MPQHPQFLDPLLSERNAHQSSFRALSARALVRARYPVMNVPLVHSKGQGVFASFGAHPASKLRWSAMTELLHGRASSQEDIPEPGFDMSEIDAVAKSEIHYALSKC